MVVNWFVWARLVEGKTRDVGVLMGDGSQEAINALTVSVITDSIGAEVECGAEELVT